VLIPDLQRPYVWTPNNVSLLIDSLIRGWPFGTLLLWKVASDEFKGIPSRCFWKVVDRTNGAAETAVSQMNPPAEYHMVLDGQQRVQSLLLAVGGDSWGFKLEDRDWTEELRGQRPRGRAPKYKHWSTATLCFDLDAFLREYNDNGQSFLAVDFRKVLVWAVTDPQNGISKFPKPDNYEQPLVTAYSTENKGRYIRLGRLWKEAQPNPGLKESQFKTLIRPVLEQHGVENQKIDLLLQPMGELMTTLRDVKMSDINYLELQPFDPVTWTRTSYNDAIVSIFTRLNTAGRTLTREEITLAWLKVGWDTNSTLGATAGQCFEKLRSDLIVQGLELPMDELVGACSLIWSVFSSGKPLTNSDLLDGEVIRPMALALSKRWPQICTSLLTCVSIIRQRGFEYGAGKHFFSLYALALPCAWLYIAEQWKADHKLGVIESDAFDKEITASLNRYMDRWILCSQWAGRWSGSSDTTVAAYVKNLHEKNNEVGALADSSSVLGALDKHLRTLVDDLSADAANYAATAFPTVGRDRVSTYRNLLWIWHRLDEARWKMSQVQLRIGKSEPAWEVDHTVAFALWEEKIALGLPEGIQDHDDALALVNRLGNCVLLEKNFNISKSKNPVGAFLGKIYEFQNGSLKISDWSSALSVPVEMLDPTDATVDAIKLAIDNRDKEMRDELADFARGKSARVDIEALGSVASAAS